MVARMILATLFVFCACDVQELTVVRAPGTLINDAIADDRFLGMSAAIALSQYPDDFACNADGGGFGRGFARVGPVTLDLGLQALLLTNADVTEALARPGWVKVVSSIMECGFVGVNILACSDNGGTSFVAVENRPQQTAVASGVAWAHEHGHPVGNTHRIPDNDPTALMSGAVTAQSTKIDQFECSNFLKDVDGRNGIGLPVSSTSPQVLSSAGGRSRSGVDSAFLLDPGVPIEEFVRQSHFHGLPFIPSESYSEEDVDRLLEMLKSPADLAHRGKMAGALGMIGGPEVAPILMSMVLSGRSGSLEWWEARDVSAALIGLGYLAHRIDEESIVRFLIAASTSGFWAIDTPGMRDLLWSSTAYGLGLSGRPGAMRRLSTMWSSEARPRMRRVVKSSMRMNETVSSEGLIGYYTGDPIE